MLKQLHMTCPPQEIHALYNTNEVIRQYKFISIFLSIYLYI